MSSPIKTVLALAFAVALLIPARGQVTVGDAFPSLSSAGLAGGAAPATDGKIVLVDFWASWCAPCKASFASLGRINADFASRGLVIVAVSVDEKPMNYSAFVKKWQPPFPALLDQNQKLVGAVKVPAMPTSYLVGRDGRVRFVHQGFHGSSTETEWRAHIESLLAEKS
jgi:thiol-disulfide isomerase/thioredoxin